MQVIGHMADGTLIGEKDGKLYRGAEKKVGFDELYVEAVVSDDGEGIEKVERYGEHITGKCTLRKSGFMKGVIQRMLSNDMSEEDAEKVAEKMWESEKESKYHRPSMMDAVDAQGNLVQIPRKQTIIEWEAI